MRSTEFLETQSTQAGSVFCEEANVNLDQRIIKLTKILTNINSVCAGDPHKAKLLLAELIAIPVPDKAIFLTAIFPESTTKSTHEKLKKFRTLQLLAQRKLDELG